MFRGCFLRFTICGLRFTICGLRLADVAVFGIGAAATRRLGERLAGHGAGGAVLDGDGLHRGGVAQGQRSAVESARGRGRAAISGVADFRTAFSAHRHLGGLRKRSGAADGGRSYGHGLTATGLWRHTAALNTNTSISLGKSASEAGHALEVFAYGIVLEPKTSDALASLNQTGANQAGFILDLNKVSTTSFDFSPTISATLAVEGDGTTSGGSSSSNTGGDGGGSQPQTVAAPTISGTTPFEETTQVTMSAESGAEIRYTTDASTPTAESSLYSAALTLSATTTVKAIAIQNGTSSSVASQTFTKSSGGGGTDPDNGDVG